MSCSANGFELLGKPPRGVTLIFVETNSNVKEHILRYYISEKQGATAGLLLAAVFLLSSLILWRLWENGTLQRGMACILLATGLLIAIACAATVMYNNHRIRQTEKLSITDNADLQHKETARMEKVMSGAYIGGLSLFGLSLITGIMMSAISSRPTVKGMAIGLLLFGLVGIVTEFISMKRNRQYLNEIRQLKF